MFGLKYYDGIRAAQAATAAEKPAPLPPFDLLGGATRGRLRQWAWRFAFRRVMPAAFALLRWLRPNFRIGRLVIVTRDADVREVLGAPTVFTVPFALEMTELAGGTNSVLGLEGPEHDALRAEIARVLRREDLDDIRRWSRGCATNLVETSGGELDVIGDLVTRVATETCCRYFGLTPADPDAFAQWAIAVSQLLFADPTGDPATRRLALNGAARLRQVIDAAIARVRAYDAEHPDGTRPRRTVIDRLIGGGVLSDAQIRATIMGLATGFIPTNTLAAGNMLEELLARPRMFAAAAAAARAGDADALRRVLLSAGCRNPALSPGQWRYAATDGVIAAGTRRACHVPAGSVLLVSILSALRDPQGRFAHDPDPEKQAELLFGVGPHSCMGRWIATEQIVQTFLVLLAQPGLAPARGKHGWMQRVGPFPVRFDMRFAAPQATQSMIIATLPVRDGASIETIERALDALGNPVRDDVAAALARTGCIHFASLSVIEGTPGDETSGILVLEVNADGPRDAVLETLAEVGHAWLAPIVAHADPHGRAPTDAPALAGALRAGSHDLHCYPWGPIGIHFNGTPEFPVPSIARQAALADFARDALKSFNHDGLGEGARAMKALTRVRRLVKADSFYQLRSEWRLLCERARAFEFAAVRPTRNRLLIAEWQPPASIWAPLVPLLRSRDGLTVLAALGAVWLSATALLLWTRLPLHGAAQWATAVATTGVGGLVAALVLTAVLLGAFLWQLRRQERSDSVDDRAPHHASVAELTRREDQPGFEQNHILAVMPLKPGVFRKLVFAFALWGIKQSIRFWFRPGFVVTMGTIHYAKWFRVPGTEQFVFLSNYDGSWQSYLEDFITRAHWGQSAAWSNGVGFPRTRFLIFDGAADGDRFKRWVRRQQRPTRFWYSRFPAITTQQLRVNALIEDGLARATSDTDARRWLACFGSAQREENQLESAEVQSLVFGGFGNMAYATCLPFRLPDGPAAARTWLRAVTGLPVEQAERAFRPTVMLEPDRRLPRAMRVAFGDHRIADGAAVLGLSARGLARLGLGDPVNDALASFPAAFVMGMAARGRTLGDEGDQGSADWRWSDAAADGADGVLTVYGQFDATAAPRGGEEDGHAALVAAQRLWLEQCGGAVIDAVPTRPVGEGADARLDREHFGFRDGISQPVVRGTQRAADAIPPRDLVESGEFILGYHNNQLFYPPTIAVPEESDRGDELAIVAAGLPAAFPRFGSPPGMVGARDFGRNGTFLVVRQLDQDVDGFHAAAARHADTLRDHYPHLSEAIGRRVDGGWVAAKMVGRWPDGSPLVGNPNRPAREGTEPDNDFAFGTDDAQGLQCPLGAHVRRANPRDSFKPGDATEQAITNRHRLIRRGRSYDLPASETGDPPRKGLLFMALCADLERQFEFVQHSWIGSRSFHGLAAEGDALLGSAAGTGYTIPTAGGALTLEGVSRYVTLRAGGYFFVPSRAALNFLCYL